MTQRYWTFAEQYEWNGKNVKYGVVDHATNAEYQCSTPEAAKALAQLLNTGQDCRFNCRARREKDYLQGWIDRDRDCPIIKAGKRAATRYVDTGSGRVGEGQPKDTGGEFHDSSK